jgi:hypothetical protein
MTKKATAPIAPSTRTEAEGIVGCEARTSPKAKPKKTQAAAMLSVYDGQTWRSSIAEVNGAFVAYDSAGALIGKFQTLRAASRAIPSAELAS